MAARKAKFLVEAEDGTRTAMQSVERNLGRVNSAAERVSATFQGVFLASMAISFGKAMVQAASEAEQSSSRLVAVLRATGNAAGFAKDELDDMADSLAATTQFDDESIRDAQSTLLKFGVIQEQIFTRALKLSADYAAFMGSAIPEAAQNIGKALASPVEGLGTLERQIGKISPAARQMIEDMVQAGDVMKAQNAILDILKDRIGGTAEEMNTGLTRSTKALGKEWDDLMEDMGKTPAIGGSVNLVFRNIKGTLTDIREIINNGDWTEKFLGMTMLMTGQTGFKLTKFGGDPDAAGRAKADKAAKDNPPSLIDWDKENKKQQEGIKAFLEKRKQAGDEAKRLQDKTTAENEKAAQAYVDVEEEAAKAAAEAWKFYDEQIVEQHKKLTEDAALQWKQVFETIDQEQEDAITDGQILLDGLEEKADKAKDAARELGLTFSSAFEDAIGGGKGLRDVLGGLAMDVAKIAVRKTVTEPIADGVSGFFKNIDFSNVFDFFGGGKAEGGEVMAGTSYLVGERGPERFTPDTNGTITPNHAMGGVTIVQHMNFGSDVDRGTLRAWGERVKQESVAAVADARMRGGAYAGAFRG